MALAANLGFPRIGARRELKRALERFWTGTMGREELLAQCRRLRAEHWRQQREAGIERVAVNDFSMYDHVLDMARVVGAVPPRFREAAGDELVLYFGMARGLAGGKGGGVPAMEMTKWFDTNYHYLVPELEAGQTFRLESTKPLDELAEAQAAGLDGRVVLLGPLSFLQLSKLDGQRAGATDGMDGLVEVYEELLDRLAGRGAAWVQLDEPCLVLDLNRDARAFFRRAYARLTRAAPGLRLMLATYFGPLGDNLPLAAASEVDALHVDLVRGRDELSAVLAALPQRMSLSVGVVDGRNVWKCDLEAALALVERAVSAVGVERVEVAPSCSLLHVPVDLELERGLGDAAPNRHGGLDVEVRGWLAFARQKLREVSLLAEAARTGRASIEEQLAESSEALAQRRHSSRIHRSDVAARLAAVSEPMLSRGRPYGERAGVQRRRLGLPALPTTTIGSFPQTAEVRKARADFKAGRTTPAEYEAFCQSEIERTIRIEEQLGLDVLVHGECERNDMVEYFAGELEGYALTSQGWVQSYGSRCVKPPVLFGDVAPSSPITVGWAAYAQSLTDRPVKGMLTGPVTMLKWSFVRDDQPLETTCRQVALALRDEVAALQAAGIGIIQIDEPALREGLPLRRAEREDYLRWAVEGFRLAASAAAEETQIHTHMCYAEFADILDAIVELDADVLSIETARSRMELLEVFESVGYPNEIGPGVYDIHSPRVPGQAEMEAMLRRACRSIPPQRLWVNPDCGLKTRRWEEVLPALAALVAAARRVRSELSDG